DSTTMLLGIMIECDGNCWICGLKERSGLRWRGGCKVCEYSGCEGCGGGDCVYGKFKLWGICLGELG
ncbi:hypothetical protein, partial [Staphylococcus capitis]|uniref:hypothetical protein n=1 Tax=Staphylococcus capitis TaxID=29388 RepID=UPI003709BD05